MTIPAGEGEKSAKASRPKLTRAGRLLQLVTAGGGIDLDRIGRWMHVPAHALETCRDGLGSLDPEVQLVLAAVVLELAPQHAAQARRLYAQAQSALRVQQGLVQSHITYHGPRSV